tara:strand:- start:484 stop:1092 length:609 start_codon:yes stop_codon:yes gene_type:complete
MNKGQIRAHFLALLNRSDCPDALADTFIDQATTRIQRVLRTPAQEAQQTYTISSTTSQIAIPSNLLEIISVYMDGVALTRIPHHEMLQAQATGEQGTPRVMCRQQANILLHPQPTTGTIYLDYYAEFPTLATDSDSNALTAIASDILTYTALSYAADWFMDERAALFEQKSGQFLAELQEQSNSAEQSGINQVVRPTVQYGS